MGTPDVLASLREIAPVVAVRGNNDSGPWADALPSSEVVELGSVALYLLHDPAKPVNPQMLARARGLSNSVADVFSRATGGVMKVVPTPVR